MTRVTPAARRAGRSSAVMRPPVWMLGVGLAKRESAGVWGVLSLGGGVSATAGGSRDALARSKVARRRGLVVGSRELRIGGSEVSLEGRLCGFGDPHPNPPPVGEGAQRHVGLRCPT